LAGFASITDMAEMAVSSNQPGLSLYACTAEGDPNPGVVVGKNGVVVVDAKAMSRDVVARTASVTDVEVIRMVVLHYHAV